VEEARRYAGGVDDPALLATAFAGVAGSMSSNAIVVRGNAPKGLLWQMELFSTIFTTMLTQNMLR
jgi:hypothetical protein